LTWAVKVEKPREIDDGVVTKLAICSREGGWTSLTETGVVLGPDGQPADVVVVVVVVVEVLLVVVVPVVPVVVPVVAVVVVCAVWLTCAAPTAARKPATASVTTIAAVRENNLDVSLRRNLMMVSCLSLGLVPPAADWETRHDLGHGAYARRSFALSLP
jgi:hypothetical protein